MNLQLFKYKRGEEYSVEVVVNDGSLAYHNIIVPTGTDVTVKAKLLEEAETAVLKKLEEDNETQYGAV